MFRAEEGFRDHPTTCFYHGAIYIDGIKVEGVRSFSIGTGFDVVIVNGHCVESTKDSYFKMSDCLKKSADLTVTKDGTATLLFSGKVTIERIPIVYTLSVHEERPAFPNVMDWVLICKKVKE